MGTGILDSGHATIGCKGIFSEAMQTLAKTTHSIVSTDLLIGSLESIQSLTLFAVLNSLCKFRSCYWCPGHPESSIAS